MDTLKLKIEIGDRRFEADGPSDVVSTHANVFMKLTLGGNAETIATESRNKASAEQISAQNALQLQTILRVEGSQIALNLLPKKREDALLTLMLGHRNFRKHSLVSATELARGLSESGIDVKRSDHLLMRCQAWKYVSSIGRYRNRRWELTEAGIQRAEAVTRALIAVRAKQQEGT